MKKIIKIWIYILILGTFNPACAGADDISESKEYVVSFSRTGISLKAGKRQLLIVEFNQGASELDYNWINSNPEVIELVNEAKNMVTVRGLSVGSATVTLESAGKEVTAQCEVT